MNNIRHILFIGDAVTDSPDCSVLEYALELAQQHQAKITVLDVMEPYSSATRLLANLALPVEEVYRFSVQERGKELAALVAPYREQGINIDSVVAEGKAFIEIIRYVLKTQCDLVIKVAQGAGSHLFGSTDTSLLRKCPCPVWLFNGSKKPQFNRILAAVDIDKPDQDYGINKVILDYASALAVRENSELHLVQCWSLPGETTRRFGLGRMSQDDLERVTKLSELSYQNWLEELMEPHKVILQNQYQLHLRKGDPKFVLPLFAEQENIDLIVMGSIHRSGVAGMLIGTTAESIFCQAKTAVVAVKPDDFVTPVTLPTAEPTAEKQQVAA